MWHMNRWLLIDLCHLLHVRRFPMAPGVPRALIEVEPIEMLWGVTMHFEGGVPHRTETASIRTTASTYKAYIDAYQTLQSLGLLAHCSSCLVQSKLLR